MAWSFGDGFDLYAAPADMVFGYWDSLTNVAGMALLAGRFAGSQALRISSTTLNLAKSSGANDAVHHIVVAFQQGTTAIGGSTLGAYIGLYDGATAQCSIVFRSDGAILLTSGASTGTVLATYTGAFPVVNTWYAFEFEAVINNTTGSFTVRKNGNNVADFTATALNTRGGTANNYANKLQIGMATTTVNAHFFDDLFWRSDASAVAWMGDIRCYTRMPASDASTQFSRVPTSLLGQNNPSAVVGALSGANSLRGVPISGPMTGTLTSLVCQFNAGVTGHVKMALYDSTGASGNAGALLASSIELTNPGAGLNTFSIAAGPTIVRGTTYWIVFWADVNVTFTGGGSGASGIAVNAGNTIILTYTGTFPSSFGTPTNTSTISAGGCLGMNVTATNAGCVADVQQDAFASYVYSNVPGQADLYTIGSISSTPIATVAITARSLAIKSDAGTRTLQTLLKSGPTLVATATTVLTTSNWTWTWRTDSVDPNTGAPWTAGAVNTAQIGVTVVA